MPTYLKYHDKKSYEKIRKKGLTEILLQGPFDLI